MWKENPDRTCDVSTNTWISWESYHYSVWSLCLETKIVKPLKSKNFQNVKDWPFLTPGLNIHQFHGRKSRQDQRISVSDKMSPKEFQSQTWCGYLTSGISDFILNTETENFVFPIPGLIASTTLGFCFIIFFSLFASCVHLLNIFYQLHKIIEFFILAMHYYLFFNVSV